MQPKFMLFEPDHLVVLALTVIVPVVLAFVSAGGRRVALDKTIRWSFAAALIATWIGWYVLFISRGWLTWGNALPMNLCDWATIAVLAACITHNQKAYELAYFWSLAGTMQGLITPDVNFPFPEPQFIVFMLGHALIIGAVIYLTAGSAMRPIPRSLPRVAVWTLLYAAAASATDWLLGVNYGFFRAKPGHATAYDYLSAWPAYIPETIALGLLAILVLYTPWFLVDWARRRR